jgi:hypothetical protein
VSVACLALTWAEPLFAKNATRSHDSFWEKFAKRLLHEGKDHLYPMPPSREVTHLLEALRDVPGVALSTYPETTVTEGQGYAMLTAGMRKDVELLKKLTVAWQVLPL